MKIVLYLEIILCSFNLNSFLTQRGDGAGRGGVLHCFSIAERSRAHNKNNVFLQLQLVKREKREKLENLETCPAPEIFALLLYVYISRV